MLQLTVQIPELRRLGYRFDFDWPASRATVGEIVRALGPMALGLAVTQLNTLGDSLIAWGLTATEDGPATIVWLGDLVQYPFRQGAIAAMYFGERLYQFPLGILGMAVATTIFPALSRHAAQKALHHLGADLSAGLRLVFFLGLPAGAGLWLLADPLATLFFQHGARVTEFDMNRVARVVECYALGVWAFCALPVLVRGYYALGNQHVPLRIALQTVAINLGFNLVLIWRWAEAGLALSTSLAAMFQAVVLVVGFKDLGVALAWADIRRTVGHTALATAAMLLAGVMALGVIPADGNLAIKLARVLVPLLVSAAVFAAIGRLLRAEEFAFLGWGPKRAAADGSG
jgi:putative peptidoglycan lipid II flippase